jgi:hypothetical protein
MRAKPITSDTRWQTFCIYGASGAGKSTLAATAPHPYILDSNQGLLSIAGRKGFEHVRGDDVHSMADLDAVYANCTGTGEHDWTKKFDTVVFDHFDDIQGIVLDLLADRAAEKDDRREVDQLEQREYGVMGNKLRRYMRKFKRVPKHKILICGESQDFETGRLRPSLVGALKNQLPYFCDHILYLRIGKKGVRYLHLESTDEFYAKTRAWWLPPELRKIRLSFDNTKTLSTLFARIAAGPTATSKRHSSEESTNA